MYYIYKEKHEEEKDGVNDKDTKKFDYTKLRLTDDYEYESQERVKETNKKPDKKEPPKKPTENSVKKFSELVNKKETDMNREIFQKHFNFSKPSGMLREYGKQQKNKESVDLVKSRLRDLKDETKKCVKMKLRLKNQI